MQYGVPAMVVLAMMLSGCGAPTIEDVQERWDEGDAAGNKAAYRIQFVEDAGDFGTIDGTIEHNPRNGKTLVSYDGIGQTYSEKDSPEFYWIQWNETWYMGRDYSEKTSGDGGPTDEAVNWTAQDDSTFTGETPSGFPASLTLDEEGRFLRATIGSTSELAYQYSNIEPIETPEDPTRVTVAIDVPPFQEPGVREFVQLSEIDAFVKPNELEIHFFNESNVVIKTAPWTKELDKGGYYFLFEDADENGLVNPGDAYRYQFPNTTAYYDIYDVWAGDYQGEVVIPGVGFMALALAIGIAGALSRKRF